MPLLIVSEPQPNIFVVVGEIVGALSVLLVLEPLTLIFLSVKEGIDAIALPFPLDILALKTVAVLIGHLTFAMRFTSHHLSVIVSLITRHTRAKGYLLRSRH